MVLSAVLDLAVAAVLILSVIRGARRGLITTVASVAVTILALLGASFLADNFSPLVADLLEPSISSRVELNLSEGVQAEEMTFFGVRSDLAAEVSSGIAGGLDEVGDTLSAMLASSFAELIAKAVVWMLAFILLLLALRLIVAGLNTVFRLPGLNLLNRMGGLLAGVLLGLLWVFVLATAAGFFDSVFTESVVEGTWLYRYAAEMNPFGAFFRG